MLTVVSDKPFFGHQRDAGLNEQGGAVFHERLGVEPRRYYYYAPPPYPYHPFYYGPAPVPSPLAVIEAE